MILEFIINNVIEKRDLQKAGIKSWRLMHNTGYPHGYLEIKYAHGLRVGTGQSWGTNPSLNQILNKEQVIDWLTKNHADKKLPDVT